MKPTTVYTLNPDYKDLMPLIEKIKHYFQQSSEILYDQRNQIRVVPYKGEEYVVKSFKIPNWVNRFVYRYLRPSKAKRSYDYSFKIGQEYCPQAIAYIEQHHNGLLGESYYIAQRYHYDFTIRPVLLDESFDSVIRKQVLEDFAEFSFRLHESNILHQDYSYGNILIKKRLKADAETSQYEFKIIDVNRMQFKNLSLNDRLENFARLSADDDAMDIIIGRYAQCIHKDANELLPIAKHFRDEFTRKRILKNKLRGW